MKRRRRDPNGMPRARLALLIAGVGILALILMVDYNMRPIIESMAAYQAKVAGVRAMNEAMTHELKNLECGYDDLVRITYGSEGGVRSIQANMAAINGLKARIGESALEGLNLGDNRKVSLPVGTLLGNQFTSGRGPRIEIMIVPAGVVNTRIYNQFTSAGINQTLHQIMLEATVRLIAVMPGYRVDTETTTNFCIAETIIVGEIPQGYASFN